MLTDLGDPAVILPLGAAVLAWLAVCGRHPAPARAWALGLGVCGSVMVALKLAFRSCGHALIHQVTSPSGHAAMSTFVYVGLALLAGRGAGPLRKGVLAAAGLALAVAIGVSRLVVGAHDAAEVVIGLAVGAASLALLATRMGPDVPVPGATWALAAALAAMLVLDGAHWPVEEHLRAVALWMGGCGHAPAAAL